MEKRKNGNIILITDTRIHFSEIIAFRVSKNEEMKQLSFINLETSYFSDARREKEGEKEGSQNILCDRQSYMKHTNTFSNEYSRSCGSSFLPFIHLFI